MRSATPATAAPQAFAETCPQYLFLSLDDMGNGFEGAKFVCSPPLRRRTALGRALDRPRKDDLQVVSTDHCPFDFHGQKELGRGDFRKIPNGLPGVEDRVDLLHDGGVVGGRISKERWVEVISTAPAKLFGMYPRKGAIAVGADADIVVYDPNRRRARSRATTHHMDVDYSCYEGREVQGASDVVLSRGSVVVRERRVRRREGPRPVRQARDRGLRPARLSLLRRQAAILRACLWAAPPGEPVDPEGARVPDPAPFVSIVVPCWNAAGAIGRSLASVLDGHEVPVECVVVDDASTDGSADVVKAIADRDPRVVLLPRPGESRGLGRPQPGPGRRPRRVGSRSWTPTTASCPVGSPRWRPSPGRPTRWP